MTAATLDAAIAHCRRMISKGSKSFSLAARIFGAETRDAAFCLYGWCRYCDDVIDGSDLGVLVVGAGLRAGPNCAVLLKKTKLAYSSEPMSDPVFIAFQHLVKKYGIPIQYPLDLLEGMAMDVRKDRYETFADLKLYCYRVAGTVGVMMSHIMGVSDDKAFEHAIDMGIAMQLTNIARDVRDDWDMGRVYLPLEWLRESGVPVGDLMNPVYKTKLAAVVKRVLSEADAYYRSGDAGLVFLPFRSSLAVASARAVYSEIGRQVLAKGDSAFEGRTVVPAGRKILVMMRALMGRLS